MHVCVLIIYNHIYIFTHLGNILERLCTIILIYTYTCLGNGSGDNNI